MKNVRNPSDIICDLKWKISSKTFHTNPQDYALILSELQTFCYSHPCKDFIRTNQKDVHTIICGCIGQIFTLRDPLKFQPYLLVLRVIIKELRHTIRSEQIIKQILPLVCATMWINDEKLHMISVTIIRLSIRYHPRVACEIVLKPLLDAADRTDHEELLKLLFYIHAYNPICFRSHYYGRVLLSIFIRPPIHLTTQTRCLTLLHRIVDDLPLNKPSNSTACFGNLGECFEILLNGASGDNGALLSSLMIKLAKHNLPEAMSSHANGNLPNRLKLQWPGCLEAALGLLVALAHDCYRCGHTHSHTNQSQRTINQGHNCIPGCLDAIFNYMQEADQAKHVISCLVALQDLAPIVGINLSESHKNVLENACRRVGLHRAALSKDIWMKNAMLSSPYRDLTTHFDLQQWLSDESQCHRDSDINSQHLSSMTTTPNTEPTSSSGSSSSLTTISSSSSQKASSSVAENTVQSTSATSHQLSKPNNQNIASSSSQGLYENHPAETEQNHADSSDQSWSSSRASLERLNPDWRPYASYSLPKQCGNLVYRPLVSNHQPSLNAYDARNKVHRVSSMKQAPTETGLRQQQQQVRVIRRSQSSYRSNQPVSFEQGPRVYPDPISQTLPAKSAPHLSPLDQHDPIQRFHQRYYDKLLQYVALLQNYFPFPVAVSYQDPRDSQRALQHGSDDCVVWLGDDCAGSSAQRPISSESRVRSNALSRSERRELHLYFACPARRSQCVYPGTSLNECFKVKTKYPLLWLQLLILWNQSRYGTAIPSNHPAMVPLRQLWAEIVNMPIESRYERQSRPTEPEGSKSVNHRPLSACEATQRSSVALNQSNQTKSSVFVSRLRVWNSTRIRSKSSLAKVSSFFLLATRAYPNHKDCERLAKELKDARFFESFVVQDRQKMDESNRVRRSYSDCSRKRVDERPHRWGCVLCTYTESTQQSQTRAYKNGAPLAQRETDSETCYDGSIYFPAPIHPDEWIPQMTGVLKSRYLKNVPKALSWLSSWQLNEFVLRDNVFGWRRWIPHRTTVGRDRGTVKTLSNGKRSPGNSLNRFSDTSRMARELAEVSMNSDIRTKGSSERSIKNLQGLQQWTAFHVSAIRTIQCTRKSRTGRLSELIIHTDNLGVLLLRSSRSRDATINQSTAHIDRNSPTIRPPITYTHSDELTVWLHCLQAAVTRARQGTVPT